MSLSEEFLSGLDDQAAPEPAKPRAKNILSAANLSKAIGVSTPTIYNIYRETKNTEGNPFEPDKPVRADLHALLDYVRKRQSRIKHPGGARIKIKDDDGEPILAADQLAKIQADKEKSPWMVDPSKVPELPPYTGSLDDDIATARLIAERMRSVVSAWNLNSLAHDKDSARVFGNYTEVLSRTLQRIGKQEKELLAIKKERGTLLPVGVVNALMRQMVETVIAGISDHTKTHVDIFKGHEIEHYQTSTIDSERMRDDLTAADETFRERMAQAYERMALPETGTAQKRRSA